jgi:hypothetical protein
MENDAIRVSSGNVLVDIWIDGKVRAVCVSREAIGAHLGFDQAEAMSDEDRREFVRANLSLVVAAAKARLSATNPATDAVTIDAGQLPRNTSRGGDRRTGERRKTERRKAAAPAADLPNGERRRGDRRQKQRRRPADPTEG